LSVLALFVSSGTFWLGRLFPRLGLQVSYGLLMGAKGLSVLLGAGLLCCAWRLALERVKARPFPETSSQEIYFLMLITGAVLFFALFTVGQLANGLHGGAPLQRA
jgi:Ca2+/Na+ antiporter